MSADNIFVGLFISAILFFFGLFIIHVIFMTQYISYELNNQSNFFLNIQGILNTKFIYEFNPRTKCYNNEEKLNLGIWDGAIDKCDCGSFIKNSSCIETDVDCKTVSNGPKNYTIFDGKEICVIRKGETYFNLIKSGKIISSDINCSGNDKSCGIVDTLNRKLCINKNENCPLDKDSMDKEYSKIQLKKYINFFKEEVEENKILTIIKLSDGIPCLNDSEKTWKSYHPEEKYKNQTCTPINGKTYDDRYEKFNYFKTNKSRLYKDNDLSYYITENLDLDQTIINLYGRTIIGIDVGEEGFDYDKLLSSQDKSNYCEKIMIFVNAIMICGVIISLVIGKIISKCDPDNRLEDIKAIIDFVFILIGFSIDLVLCIIIFISTSNINMYLSNIENIADEVANSLIKEIIETYSLNYSFILAIFICEIIFIVHLIIFLVRYIIFKKII